MPSTPAEPHAPAHAPPGHAAAQPLRARSLVNNTSPDFEAGPYEPASFPFSAEWHPERHLFRPAVAHFLALCMKLVYEQEELIQVGAPARVQGPGLRVRRLGFRGGPQSGAQPG